MTISKSYIYICIIAGNNRQGTISRKHGCFGIGHYFIINKQTSSDLEGFINGKCLTHMNISFLEENYKEYARLTELECIIYGIDHEALS